MYHDACWKAYRNPDCIVHVPGDVRSEEEVEPNSRDHLVIVIKGAVRVLYVGEWDGRVSEKLKLSSGALINWGRCIESG